MTDKNQRLPISYMIHDPYMGQAKKERGGVQHVCGRSSLPLTWDSIVTT